MADPRLTAGLWHAIGSDEIVLHYQPQIELASTRVHGAEALVRWNHRDLGLLHPDAFISGFEQGELLSALTRQILELAIAQCGAWRQDGRELSVAVNLSPRNLLEPDLPHAIERMLAHRNVPPHALGLEIKENMPITDGDRALATVARLSTLGVRLSLDNFGLNYGTLSRLSRLPFGELKLPHAFISQLVADDVAERIVDSMIMLSRSLEIAVVATGVEDESTLARLTALGCDRAQGNHLSAPLPADAFAQWVARRESREAVG